MENLTAPQGCYIYASAVEPNSTAKSVLKLWPADNATLGSAAEVIDQLNRLAIYSPGYGSGDVTQQSFKNFNRLSQLTDSSPNSTSPDGVAVLAISH